MNFKHIILSVGINADTHNQQTAEWGNYDVGTQKADTMQEAILYLSRKNDYLFVSINDDTVPDYLEQLHIMREITDIPIFVFTSDYNMDKRVKAINAGADFYDFFHGYAKEDVLAALSCLKAQNRWRHRPNKPLSFLICDDIILSSSSRCVFVKNSKVFLTVKEFELLRYLMVNNGQVLTHEQLLRKIWGFEWRDVVIARLIRPCVAHEVCQNQIA